MNKKIFLFLMLFCLFTISVSAQNQVAEKQTCEPPFYTYTEVSEKAKKIRIQIPQLTDEYRKNRPKENRAILSAVLCSTGAVTDIQIVKGLPFGMNERLIEAVRRYEFTPAQKDGKIVSQKQIFEFRFGF
jgi:hypothetical protein